MDARGKFGEHEKCIRVARGAAESNFSVFSALQTSQVHSKLDIRTAKSMSKFFYSRATKRICAKKPFIVIECEILTTPKKIKQTSLLADQKHATIYTLVWARTFDLVNR